MVARHFPREYPEDGPFSFIFSSTGVPDAFKGVKLDATGKLDISFMPPAVVGEMTYKGLWDASGGGTPAGTDNGDFYIVSVDGTIDPGARPVQVSDIVIYNSGSGQYDIVDSGGLPEPHATTHEKAGSDQIEIASMGTAETNLDRMLTPDGAGGVQWIDNPNYRLTGQSVDGNPIELLLSGGGRIPVPTGVSAYVTVKLIGRQTADTGGGGAVGDSKSIEMQTIIKNIGDVISRSGGIPWKISPASDASAAGWDGDVTADDPNDAMNIKATGEVGKTIEWVADVKVVKAQ